jgi:hypothetical protein
MESYNSTQMNVNTDDGNLVEPEHLPPRIASAASALAAIAPIDLATSALCCCSVLGNLAGRYEGLTRSGVRLAPHCNVILACDSGPSITAFEQALFAPVQACADALAAKAAMIPADEIMSHLKAGRFVTPGPAAGEGDDDGEDDIETWYARYAKYLIRLKPVTYHHGTDPDALRAALRQSFDDTVLLNGIHSPLAANLARSGRTAVGDRNAAKQLAAFLRRDTICLDRTEAELAGKRGYDGISRFELPAVHPGGGVILCAALPHVMRLLTPGGILSDVLATNCVLVESTCPEVGTNTVETPNLASWRDLVHEAYYRRCHPGAVNQATANLFDLEFPEYDRDLTNVCASLPAELRDVMAQGRCWPYRLAYVLVQSCRNPSPQEIYHCIAAADRLARTAVMMHIEVVLKAWSSQRTRKYESAEDVMWRKLAHHGGPISFRSLVRLYRDQRTAVHRPVLEKLMRKGVVRRDADGLYHADHAASG